MSFGRKILYVKKVMVTHDHSNVIWPMAALSHLLKCTAAWIASLTRHGIGANSSSAVCPRKLANVRGPSLAVTPCTIYYMQGQFKFLLPKIFLYHEIVFTRLTVSELAFFQMDAWSPSRAHSWSPSFRIWTSSWPVANSPATVLGAI